MLTIEPDKVCYVIVKAREFDVKEGVVDTEPGSNPSDDKDVSVLEDRQDDPTYEELKTFLDSLNRDELCELLALMWLGRGDYDKAEWADAIGEARRLDFNRSPDYLIGTPLLADYLEEGFGAMGHTCEDFEMGRM